jgi:hypothetical protein
MSGPKVVRIVTREEILDICRGHLARVDAALEEWTRVGTRNECIDEDALAAARRRRAALEALIRSDRFMDLQKQAPTEEAFLEEDLRRRLIKVAQAQAAARSRDRRSKETGAALLRSLEQKGPVRPELAEDLRNGREEAFPQAFEIMSSAAREHRASSELARRLREEDVDRNFSKWVADRQGATDPEIDRLENRLSELAQIADAIKFDDLHARLEEARGASASRRGLLLDGLEVEIGRTLAAALRTAALLHELRLLSAEASAAGLDGAAFDAGAESMDAAALEHGIAAARAAIEAHRAAAAAQARRAAVLKGLAELGYEVAEGMTTQVAGDSRLILRSASRPDYGVEVSPAGAKMQMRPVAFEGEGLGPDPARDRDAETIWCGDVTSLQASLAKVGTGLQIEKSLPVGAVPLKRMRLTGSETIMSAATPQLRAIRSDR